MLGLPGFKKKKQEVIQAPPAPVFWPIEDELSVADMVCIVHGGRETWAVANNEGSITQFNYLWDFQPFHETSVSDENMAGLLGLSLEAYGLEQFTISAYSNADCSRRIAQLEAEVKNRSPELQFLYKSEIARVKELAARRLRKNIRYTISNTYTLNPEEIETNGYIEKTLFQLKKQWQRLVEGATEEDQDDLLQLFQSVFETWQDYDTKLSSKLGLPLKSHTGHEIWHDQWVRVNGDRPDPGLPYYILCDLDAKEIKVIGRSGKEVAITQKFPLSLSLFDERVPVPARDVLYLPGRKEYCTVLGFSDIPEGWDEPMDKYKFLWDNLLSVDGISDFEIHSQLCWVTESGALKSLQNVTKQNLDVANTAKDKGSVDKMAEIISEQGEEALRMLLTGDRPIFTGVAIVVYATSEERLKNSVRKISARFTQPTKVYQEPNYAWKIWLQTSPFRMEPIFTSTEFAVVRNDYRQQPNASAVLGMVPGVGIRNYCPYGVEFISQKGSVPIHIGFEDEQGNPCHGIIYGGTGSGKSVISSRFITLAWAKNFVITILDLPDGKSKGSYKYLVKFLGGIEIDTGQTRGNLLEYLDITGLDAETARERIDDFHKSCSFAIQSLVLDNLPSTVGIPLTQVQGLIPRAVNQFYRDSKIQARIQAALKSRPGLPAWEAWPTLRDFLGFITNERLNQDNDGATHDAINFMRSRIRYWLEGPLARVIAEPSDYDYRKSRVVLFSMRKVATDEEAGIVGLVAQQTAERRALSAANSLFYIDECSKILKFPSLAAYIGEDYATARKKNKRMLIATQDPNAIDECAARAQILQNATYTIIGKLKKSALPHFERILGLPLADLRQNVSAKPNMRERFTPWIVDIDGLTHCRFYSADIPLTAVLTNGGQVALRNHYTQEYPNKYEALARAAADVRERNITGKGFADWEEEAERLEQLEREQAEKAETERLEQLERGQGEQSEAEQLEPLEREQAEQVAAEFCDPLEEVENPELQEIYF